MNIEFGIVRVERLPNRIVVHGRCYQGTIVIGARFNSVYRLHVLRQEDGSYGPSIPTSGQPVSLQVEGIVTYDHSVEELPEGLTGQLALVGMGADALKEGDVLGVLDEGCRSTK